MEDLVQAKLGLPAGYVFNGLVLTPLSDSIMDCGLGPLLLLLDGCLHTLNELQKSPSLPASSTLIKGTLLV